MLAKKWPEWLKLGDEAVGYLSQSRSAPVANVHCIEIVEAAALSRKVPKRGRLDSAGPLRDIEDLIPANAEVRGFRGEIHWRSNEGAAGGFSLPLRTTTIARDVEIMRTELDEYAAAYHSFPPPKPPDDPKLSPPQVATPNPMKPSKTRPADKEVCKWYAKRMSDWPEGTELPTEKQDVAAAHNEFDDVERNHFVTRPQVRKARKYYYAPAGGLNPGPRKATKSP